MPLQLEGLPPIFQRLLDVLGITVESAINRAVALSDSIGLGPEWNAEMSDWLRLNVAEKISPILVEAIISDVLKIMRGEPTGYWKDAGGSI